MDLEPQTATETAPRAMFSVDTPRTPAGRVTTGTLLLLASWVGMIAGFLDLSLMVIHRRVIEGDFYRLGGYFAWLIPLGVTALVLVPAIVLAVIARFRGGTVRLRLAVGLVFFVGILDVSAGCPWSSGRRFCCPAGLRPRRPGSSTATRLHSSSSCGRRCRFSPVS